MTAPFRIGLLGASKIAPTALIAPAARHGGFALAAVAARDPARARAYAETHAIAAVADDYGALIDRDDVDVVYNALPPAAHARWTIAALQAGKAVLCEKPFARNAGEARGMVDAGLASGRPLLEAFHYRFHVVMRHAEAMIRDGTIGAITSAAAEFHAPIRRAPDELRWLAGQGGGGMMDLGCYPLHALRTLLGEEPAVASAEADFEDGVDTSLTAKLAFPNGAAATIACSMTPPTFSAWLRLEGERGRLEIINFLVPQLGCRFTTAVDGAVVEHATDGPSTYDAQIAHLHDVLTGEAAPLTGGADAIANMTAIDAIYAAARKGDPRETL